MFWHVHTWRDLRWFEMFCVKLTCSCIIALLHRWQNFEMIWKCGCCFPAPFPNTKCSTIRPPRWLQHSTSAAPRWTSPGGAAPMPSCSPRWACCGARGPGAALWPPGLGASAAPPRRRRRAPAARTPASAVDRHGSRKVSAAPWRRESFWLWAVAILIDIFWAVAIGCTYWCCLMLFDAYCKYCCLLQSTAFTLRLCRISGCTSLVTKQYSSWLNNTCLLMCWSLWRDWGPHRCSAKSAKRCSGPNLLAVASARHRSLGPWGCLSHGCAYHMAMRWSTMSPAWKTKQFQENGQRYAKSSRCGTAPSFSQKLATGLQ